MATELEDADRAGTEPVPEFDAALGALVLF